MRVFECKLSYSLISLGEDVQLNTPSKVAEYLRSAFDGNPLQEAFYCVYLDRKNHPLGRHLITLGTATGTLVSPKEIFRGAILAGATALIVAHNHPSGDPAPSQADIHVTRLWELPNYENWSVRPAAGLDRDGTNTPRELRSSARVSQHYGRDASGMRRYSRPDPAHIQRNSPPIP